MAISRLDKGAWRAYFDPKDDLIEVLMDDLDQDAALLKSVDVVDEGGAHQIIRLRDPLMLPAPAGPA